MEGTYAALSRMSLEAWFGVEVKTVLPLSCDDKLGGCKRNSHYMYQRIWVF